MTRIIKSAKDAMIHCIGAEYPSGTYCLRISLTESVNLKFGRFKNGKIINLEAGEYLYIGSALAKRGSTTLGNRLRRHTSRSEGKHQHHIQEDLLNFFKKLGISYTSKPSPKKMFWNIDHLLDLTYAEIIGIIFIRNPKALENPWSAYLENLEQTTIFEKGLGANDSKGLTHVQYVKISDEEWNLLPRDLPT